MNSPRRRPFTIGRETRIAILFGVLIAFAAVAIHDRSYEAGLLWASTAAALVAGFYFLVFRPARIPRDAVVMVKLSGLLHEETGHSPLDQLLGRGFPSLAHLRHALDAAAADPRVRAIVVEVADVQNGLAVAEELHEMLRAARDAGKRVIAVIRDDLASVRDYLIASGAGEVVINPDTMVAMTGVAAGSFFVKRALDRFQVRVQTLQWKEYKGAAETLSRESMSPELRESLEAVIHDWREVLVNRIAAARKLPPERARELTGAGFMSARAARTAGLADREGYVEDVRAEFDPTGKRKPFVSLARYLRHAYYVSGRGKRARIGVVYATGPVITGAPPAAGEFISGETTAAQIERASRDPQVAALVLRVNSPGGSAVGSDLVWRAVREAQGRGKPVVVSMGDVAASGGYYVAAAADAIVAEPSSLTGSIGVVYAKFDLSEVLANVGVGIEFVKSDPGGDALSIARSMTDAELGQLNEVIGNLYANFTAKVAQGRKLDAEATEEVARGRVWTGAAAKVRNLIDETGGMARAIQLAREKAGIGRDEPHELVSFSAPRFSAALRLALSGEEPATWVEPVARALGVPVAWMPAMARILSRGGTMLLAPPIDF